MVTEKQNESDDSQNEPVTITEKDFREFLSATGEEQWKILLAHAEKNEKNITSKKNSGGNK